MLALLNSGNKTGFDSIIDSMLATPDLPISTRWGVEQGLWSFNIKSPFDWLQSVKNYTLEGITDRFTMPVWTADAQYESFFEGQSAKVKEALERGRRIIGLRGRPGIIVRRGRWMS